MQADEDDHQNPNYGEDVDAEVSDAEDESPILLQCRQIIDNTAQEWVVDLADELDIDIRKCNEDDWDRSKYPSIKIQLAYCFSEFGTEGVNLLESVIANVNYREVHTLLVDAGLIELDSDLYIENSNDGILSSDENEVEGGIGNWSDELSESDHDDQPAELPVGEVGNVVTDTREFSNAQKEELAASAGCRYIYQDETVPQSSRPLPPLPPVRGVDPNIQQHHCFSHDNGMLIIPRPQLEQSGDKRMHPTAKEIVKEYSLSALGIIKQHNHYLDVSSPTFDQHTFPLHYEKNGLKKSAAVYGVWKLIDAAWVLDKIGCALKLLGRIATKYPDAEYRVRILVDLDSIPYQVQNLLQQNTMEMIAELACPSNAVHEPLRLFCKKLLGTAGIDAGIGRSITLQTTENGVAYDLKASDVEDKVSILAEFARWDDPLRNEMCNQVVAAADSFMRLPELQRFRDEGPKRGVYAMSLINWASGKKDWQRSSHVDHTWVVGMNSVRDALPARYKGVGGGTLRYDSNYSPEELKVGAREYAIDLKKGIQMALEGNLVFCLLNFWYKYFTWNQLVRMITAVHLEVEGTSSLEVGFKMISQVFKSPLATRSDQLPSELVYFALNLPSGGSVLACVNKSFSSAADATHKINDETALMTALAQEFVATTLSTMRGETVTHMRCIQAVQEKLKIQHDLHLGKINAAAFSRYSITGIDAYLSSGLCRSKYWTKLARRQARSVVSMSSLDTNDKRSLSDGGSNAVSWYGMNAFTQGTTIPKCFGHLVIYCAESTNPALCWKKVLADLYGCDWYPILSRIAELTYNITLPSDEIQQARLVKRKAAYEEKLRLTRSTLTNQDKKKTSTFVLPEQPMVSLSGVI